MPNIPNLKDTPKRSLTDILERRQAAYDRGSSRAELLEIPIELQPWATEKMVLANKFWEASVNRTIYIERRLTDEEKTRTEELAKIKLEDQEDKETIWSEVVSVMMGEFRIDVENGKPKLVSNKYAKLFFEAVNKVTDRKSAWKEKHRDGVLGGFPKVASAVELLIQSGEMLKYPNMLENLLLVYHFAFWREKLKNEKTEQK